MVKKTKGKDILKDLLEQELDLDNPAFDNIILSDKFVIQKLTEKANAGDIRALELLGKHLKIFDKDSEKGNELIDIFAEEGTIEQNILKFLDIMEDKYADELAHAVPMLMDKNHDLYMDEKEKAQLLRQLNLDHERNLEIDETIKGGNTKSPIFRQDTAPLDPLDIESQTSKVQANIFRI